MGEEAPNGGDSTGASAAAPVASLRAAGRRPRALADLVSGRADTLALVVLAVVLGVIEDGLPLAFIGEVVGGIALLFGAIWLVDPPITHWFFRNTSQESDFEFLFVAALIFGAASLAEALGLAAILEGFVAGLAINRHNTRGGTLKNRIEFVGAS